MSKEFLYEKEFRDWYKRNTTEHEVSECVTRIKKILKGVDHIPYFEKGFLTYVPALMAKNKRLAVKLLTFVYADGYVAGNKCSHLQHYFNFCKMKRKWDGVMELDKNVLEEINDYLNSRIIWIHNENFYDEYYVNTHTYFNNLKKKMISRIDSWGRSYFPLGKIKNLIDDHKVTGKWKKETIKKIKVLTEPKKGESNYCLWDIAYFDFRMREDGVFDVYVITKKKEMKKVLTPSLNAAPRDMRVKDPGDMTIDHKKPLYSIVQDIKDKNPQLKEIIESLLINNDYSGNACEEIKPHLKRILNLVLKETECELMEKGENSRKSNRN